MKSFDVESRVLAYEPSVINAGRFVFLLTLAPSDCNMDNYVQLLKSKGVSHLIQRTNLGSSSLLRWPGSLSEPGIYNAQPIIDQKIEVINWAFPDGANPPKLVIIKWLMMLKKLNDAKAPSHQGGADEAPICIALHCVAGLGRAPLLVALALIESGLLAVDAIRLVRKKRQGAFNAKQIQFLVKYKPKNSLLENKNKENCTIV